MRIALQIARLYLHDLQIPYKSSPAGLISYLINI